MTFSARLGCVEPTTEQVKGMPNYLGMLAEEASDISHAPRVTLVNY